MVSREKEQHIRKLLKEGWDWEQIRKIAHCSPNTIQKVKEKSEQKRAQKTKSNRSYALRMYNKGNTPYDVSVKLEIPQKEAEEYQLEYWKLRNMNTLEQLYNGNKDSLPLIISMLKEMNTRNISLDLLSRAANLVYKLPQLYNEYSGVQKEIQVSRAEYKQRQEELWNIQREIKRIENYRNIDYRELCEFVSKIIHEVLSNRVILLKAALIAIIHAIGKYPEHKTVLWNLSSRDPTIISDVINDPEQVIWSELMSLANIFYDDIVAELAEKAIVRLN